MPYTTQLNFRDVDTLGLIDDISYKYVSKFIDNKNNYDCCDEYEFDATIIKIQGESAETFYLRFIFDLDWVKDDKPKCKSFIITKKYVIDTPLADYVFNHLELDNEDEEVEPAKNPIDMRPLYHTKDYDKQGFKQDIPYEKQVFKYDKNEVIREGSPYYYTIDDETDDDEVEVEDFLYENVMYQRECGGNDIYDEDSGVYVGKFIDGVIVFDAIE